MFTTTGYKTQPLQGSLNFFHLKKGIKAIEQKGKQERLAIVERNIKQIILQSLLQIKQFISYSYYFIFIYIFYYLYYINSCYPCAAVTSTASL